MDGAPQGLEALAAERESLLAHLQDLESGTIALDAHGCDVTERDLRLLRRRIAWVESLMAAEATVRIAAE
jgi:hypothetical protein